MVRTITGDIIKLAKTGDYSYLAHGCNCQRRMKSGLAKQIVENFPRVEEADNQTIKGDWKKLGTINLTEYPEVTIINAYTQFFYGTNSRKLDYEALYKCLEKIDELMSGEDSLLIPKIGCGLAGGNWRIVKTMIQEVLKDKNVKIVENE